MIKLAFRAPTKWVGSLSLALPAIITFWRWF